MERVDLARLLGCAAVADGTRPTVIAEREPARFIQAFAEAVARGGSVFLADPGWGERERAQLDALIQRSTPNIQRPTPGSGPASDVRSGGSELGVERSALDVGRSTGACAGGWLCLPTGGSSGALKFARHDPDTLAAAVGGFCDHFGVGRVNAIGLLPLYHVSGFMAWMRTLLTGGDHRPWSWKALEAGDRPELPAGDWFLSLVPTQLQRLLADPAAVAWLRGFRAVFIGGGPSWPELVEAGARAGLPLAFSYGMTESAAMVAALRPEEFLAGGRGSGAVLPHARVSLDAEGRIGLEGASLFRGYFPGWREPGPWLTDDLGRFDEHGRLHVLGRRDALIITGGEKVNPAEVEAVLRATGEFADVAVIGLPDAGWGEAVAACYPASQPAPSMAVIDRHVGLHLAPYKRPRRYLALADWPRNAQGKLNRAELRARLACEE